MVVLHQTYLVGVNWAKDLTVSDRSILTSDTILDMSKPALVFIK